MSDQPSSTMALQYDADFHLFLRLFPHMQAYFRDYIANNMHRMPEIHRLVPIIIGNLRQVITNTDQAEADFRNQAIILAVMNSLSGASTEVELDTDHVRYWTYAFRLHDGESTGAVAQAILQDEFEAAIATDTAAAA